mgnify:CR=1 FL=1
MKTERANKRTNERVLALKNNLKKNFFMSLIRIKNIFLENKKKKISFELFKLLFETVCLTHTNSVREDKNLNGGVGWGWRVKGDD